MVSSMGDEKDLRIAYSKKERSERLLANLEKLQSEGSISLDQYNSLKSGYAQTITEAAGAIEQIKRQLSDRMGSENVIMAHYEQELKNLELRLKVGELKLDDYQKAERKCKTNLEKAREKISGMQRLFNATSSSDVGGYIEASKGSSGPGIATHLPVGKKGIAIILLVVIALVAAFFIFSSGTPGDAVVKFLQHLDNGEYAQALDQAVDPGTMQPYTESDRSRMISMMQMTYGSRGENIQISNIRIVSSSKVNDNKYMVTVTATYTTKSLFGTPSTDTKTETIPVVKVNGQWRVAKTLPGFEAMLGILGLSAVAYLRRRRGIAP